MRNCRKTKIVIQSKKTDISYTDEPSPNKLTLEEMREIWNDENGSLSDEELIRVRDWLIVITPIISRVIKKIESQHKIIPLQSENNEDTQSHSICPGKYGRTG